MFDEDRADDAALRRAAEGPLYIANPPSIRPGGGCRTSPRSGHRGLFAEDSDSMTVVDASKHLMSPSMNHPSPFHPGVYAVRAVWHPRPGGTREDGR